LETGKSAAPASGNDQLAPLETGKSAAPAFGSEQPAPLETGESAPRHSAANSRHRWIRVNRPPPGHIPANSQHRWIRVNRPPRHRAATSRSERKRPACAAFYEMKREKHRPPGVSDSRRSFAAAMEGDPARGCGRRSRRVGV
jgi:hypothetical protein